MIIFTRTARKFGQTWHPQNIHIRDLGKPKDKKNAKSIDNVTRGSPLWADV